MEFADFILQHQADDPARLALDRARYAGEVEDFALALTTLEVRRKLRTKVPEWYAQPGLQYPLRLSGEQCSSSATARYKAEVAFAACTPAARVPRLADLTGGLGVDSWAFSRRFGQVLYSEMQPELVAAARHNFALLGAGTITVREGLLQSGNLSAIVGDFRPDILFLDPARRASDGRKVFRLEDCQPDVPALREELLSSCPRVLLKLSPMADISLVCKQLQNVAQVHVVAAEGECKELLLLLEKDHTGPYSLTLFEDGHTVCLTEASEDPEKYTSPFGAENRFLFEPGKALLKAGAFGWPCRFGLEPLGRHTHLYVGEGVPEALQPFGKTFRVLEVLPLDKRSLKDIGARYPQASVTARNLPLTSEELRKKLGVKDGGTVHIFGAHVDAALANFLFVVSA